MVKQRFKSKHFDLKTCIVTYYSIYLLYFCYIAPYILIFIFKVVLSQSVCSIYDIYSTYVYNNKHTYICSCNHFLAVLGNMLIMMIFPILRAIGPPMRNCSRELTVTIGEPLYTLVSLQVNTRMWIKFLTPNVL